MEERRVASDSAEGGRGSGVDLGIEGRVALVMGASRGIGRGIASALSREGARVAIAGRTRETLEDAASAIEGEVRPFPADTGDLARMRELAAEVAESLGPIEILVANTGGPPAGGALDNSVEDWETAFRSLVLAPRVLIEAVLPGMRERGWGRIVNVGSVSTREPIPGLVLSNANRAANVGLLKTLAAEVAGEGVTVNTVATGMIATDRLADLRGSLEAAEAAAREQVPAQRLGTPEEYGDLVAFLCSERAAYLTGAVIPLDGGLLRSV
jgi:3-oxoacyl-[acyl-carrier protein] reductase